MASEMIFYSQSGGKSFKISYKSCMFVDNNKENLKVAADKSMKIIYFDFTVSDQDMLMAA